MARVTDPIHRSEVNSTIVFNLRENFLILKTGVEFDLKKNVKNNFFLL